MRMELKQKYLGGDVFWLEKIDKIVPRKYELPIMLKSSEFLLIKIY